MFYQILALSLHLNYQKEFSFDCIKIYRAIKGGHHYENQ